MPDITAAAYHNTLRAIKGFEATMAAYIALLDTQSALVRAENFVGAMKLSVQSGQLARRATAYGQQLSSLRDALAEQQYQGPRATELRQHLARVERQANVTGTLALNLASTCAAKRRAAAAELDQQRQSSATIATRVRDSYAPVRHKAFIDTRL